jgi:hypothetical protein
MSIIHSSRFGFVLMAGLVALAACAPTPPRGPYYTAEVPNDRARTSTVDDYFSFKWSETGRKVEMWRN